MLKVKDHTKQCWFCFKVTIVNKGNYYQCSACGAMWNETPELGHSALGPTWHGHEGDSHFHPYGVG